MGSHLCVLSLTLCCFCKMRFPFVSHSFSFCSFFSWILFPPDIIHGLLSYCIAFFKHNASNYFKYDLEFKVKKYPNL